MGLIASALGGALQGGGEAATKALASAQQHYQQIDIEKMRDELAGTREAAADARRHANATALQEGQQKFVAGQSDKDRTFRSGESALERASREKAESERLRVTQEEGRADRETRVKTTSMSAGASIRAAQMQIEANAPQKELAQLKVAEAKRLDELKGDLIAATQKGDPAKVASIKGQIDALAYSGDKLDKATAIKAAEVYQRLASSELDPDQKAEYARLTTEALAVAGIGKKPGIVAGAQGDRPPLSSFRTAPAAQPGSNNLTGNPLLK